MTHTVLKCFCVVFTCLIIPNRPDLKRGWVVIKPKCFKRPIFFFLRLFQVRINCFFMSCLVLCYVARVYKGNDLAVYVYKAISGPDTACLEVLGFHSRSLKTN